MISRPDSGSEDNIIARDLVLQLRLDFDTSPQHQKQFRIANGKYVKALGRIQVEVAFAKDRSTALYCAFYIFEHLVSPLIMGMEFLNKTETLIKNKHRLETLVSPTSGPIQMCSLNSPRCRLFCQANLEANLANADTGSEADLMSLAYVIKRGFHMTAIDTYSSMVRFADGSTAVLAGKVDVQIVIGTKEGPSLLTSFFVLEGLTCEVLFGEDFLYELNAFETYSDAFSLTDDCDTCDANTIMWFNMAEGILSRLWGGRRKKASQSGK